MSNEALFELESYLQHLLAPLPLRSGKRHELQDEMLAHLLSVFDEEMACDANEKAAVARTLRRFGDAFPLQSDLETCVPFRERFLSWILKEKNMWRLFLATGVVAVLIGLGLVMPAVQQFSTVGAETLSVILFVLGIGICVGGVGAFAYGIQRCRVRSS